MVHTITDVNIAPGINSVGRYYREAVCTCMYRLRLSMPVITLPLALQASRHRGLYKNETEI